MPTVCPVALNARLIVRTDKPCARDRARAQMFLKKVLLDEPVDGIAQRRSRPQAIIIITTTQPASTSFRDQHHHHFCLVPLKIASDAPRLLGFAT